MGSAIIIVTFDDMESAGEALKTLESWQKDHEIELGDAVTVVKDEEGEVKIKQTEDFTPKRGAIAGGTAGLIVGTIAGGPIGGLLLGAAAGALAGKKLDLGISDDQIDMVSKGLHEASSAIFVQVKSGNKDMLAAAFRESGGTLHELSISDETEDYLQETMIKGGIR